MTRVDLWGRSGVGSVFVQIAKKVVGCKTVIGIAGGQEKCDWFVASLNFSSPELILCRVKTLGADDCFDYKVRTQGSSHHQG